MVRCGGSDDRESKGERQEGSRISSGVEGAFYAARATAGWPARGGSPPWTMLERPPRSGEQGKKERALVDWAMSFARWSECASRLGLFLFPFFCFSFFLSFFLVSVFFC